MFSPAVYLRSQALAPLPMSSAQWSLVSAQLRERAFFMAGVQQANILQLFREAAAAVADGRMSPAEARVTVRRGLAAMGYSPQGAGVAPGSIHDLSSWRRIMLALETNFSMARGWMQHLQYRTDPNVGGLELFRLFPRKVPRNWALRWAEAAEQVNWQGVATGAPFIATLDSPIWCALSRFGTPYPPFDFNSGMSTRPVDNRRCRELGLEPTPRPEILPSLNEQVEASLQGLDADIADDLLRSLGALVQRDGDTLKMTDLNGTKPYPLQELVRLLASALPPASPPPPQKTSPTSSNKPAKKRLEHHKKMDYNQPHPPMDEEIARQIKEGKTALFDANGNFLRWLTPEEEAEMSKDYDEEFMCPKPMASLLRRCREQQKMKS